jgi:diaminohydroxyphosphoribosylaminopyrimidine deaminase/5-amino-6-(5-phosphoribosylamino)uracil reductase
MRRAIDLAISRVGKTGSNPVVACVLVHDSAVIAESVTAEGGRPHAEEQALTLAGDAARGCDAFITLEPCGERSTPGAVSCAERLIRAGVGRVIVACEDPSHYAAGQGLERLRAAGITVETGVCADEAGAALYSAYFARFGGG